MEYIKKCDQTSNHQKKSSANPIFKQLKNNEMRVFMSNLKNPVVSII